MSIKKPYQELHSFLVANKNKKVSTILEELEAMMVSKTRETTSLYDENHDLVAIFCYYHKVWELVKDTTDRGNDVDYGSKANSKTGLNTMCKKGVSRWTKQQKDLKNINGDILEQVMNGEIQPGAAQTIKHTAELETREIIQEENQLVFNTVGELQEYVGHELYVLTK